MKIRGKCSWFGGPADGGVSSSEGLAWIYELDDAPHLFLPYQPAGTTGLARRLNPQKLYCAWRVNYENISKEELLHARVIVRNPATGKELVAQPADWGPAEETGRIADLSPGCMEQLGLVTDQEVEIEFPLVDEQPKQMSVAISSGHGLKIRGASGYIDEVDQARRVVPEVVRLLRAKGCEV